MNCQKAIFLLDSIALKLYNIVVRKTNLTETYKQYYINGGIYLVDLSFIGEVRKNSKGTPMKIIAARKKEDIDIQFLDEHGYSIEHQVYQNFKIGQIKNPYDKTLSGVGYIGVGKYTTNLNEKHIEMYKKWCSMIRRCYYENGKEEYIAYFHKCTVCEEWKNYQNFAWWCEKNYYEVGEGFMHLDKDILNPGNKEYSPDYCIFVPQRINMLFMNKPNKRGLPNGISTTTWKTFTAQYNGKGLGTFNSLEEAYKHYSEAKERNIKDIAEEYKGRIPNRLYEALINYKVLLENDKNYNKQLHKGSV